MRKYDGERYLVMKMMCSLHEEIFHDRTAFATCEFGGFAINRQKILASYSHVKIGSNCTGLLFSTYRCFFLALGGPPEGVLPGLSLMVS